MSLFNWAHKTVLSGSKERSQLSRFDVTFISSSVWDPEIARSVKRTWNEPILTWGHFLYKFSSRLLLSLSLSLSLSHTHTHAHTLTHSFFLAKELTISRDDSALWRKKRQCLKHAGNENGRFFSTCMRKKVWFSHLHIHSMPSLSRLSFNFPHFRFIFLFVLSHSFLSFCHDLFICL